MNRSKLLCVAYVSALLAAGCSQTGPAASGNGGSSEGGSSGSGGETASGGKTGSGGSGSGGDEATGGSESSGGVGAGGSVGSGGTSGGTGGKASGGATGSGGVAAGGSGSGGAQAGGVVGAGGTAKGGAVGSGGAAAGGAAAGGAAAGGAGSGGVTGSGGSTAGLAETVVPDLAKGFYWEGTCAGNYDPGSKNCWFYDQSTSCPASGINREITQKVGGESGKKYTVTIELRGVVGTRCYKGGTRASNAAAKEDDYNNWWYVGGSYANPTGWWNTYELKVTPATGDADQYYFNGSDNDGGNFCEREASYLVGYTASFKVVGGGSMTFKIHDQNCKAMQNCGKSTTSSDPCQPRTVDVAPMSLQPPSTSPAAPSNQPPKNQSGKTYYPQWMWIVAKSVTAA
jgi:hypothetical protein